MRLAAETSGDGSGDDTKIGVRSAYDTVDAMSSGQYVTLSNDGTAAEMLTFQPHGNLIRKLAQSRACTPDDFLRWLRLGNCT